VLLSDVELQVNTIASLSYDLVVLLDINKIVQIIHDTYQHSYFKARPYSTLDDWALGDGRASGARRDNHDSDSHAEIPVGINVCLDVLSSHVSTPGFLRQLRSPDTPSVTPEVCSSAFNYPQVAFQG
jgi:hypothetical protein